MVKRKNIEMTDEDAAEYDRLMEKYTEYDRLQYVYKIRLNSQGEHR